MLPFALFLFSLLSAAASPADGAGSPAYNTTDLFLINCGQSSDEKADSGRTWYGEDRKLVDSNRQNASFTSQASVQDSSVPRIPFTTARIFRSEFTYLFPVSRGPKFVRLYFYPTRYGSDFDAVTSFFSVTVNGFSLMRNFSASMAVTASETETKSLIKEFIIPVWDNNLQTLNLTFMPSENSLGFVNGIEIVSMPVDLYTNVQPKPVGSTVGFDIDGNSTAFETVYRLNVGGRAISAAEDTGMYRTWDSDVDYIFSAARGLTPYMPGVPIRYTNSTPRYVAPETVYATYRTMGNPEQPLLNLNFNLTWSFPVDVGFNYILRLHFCETQPEVTQENQREFTIYISNRTAEIDADVIHLSGGNGVPVFKDFVTLVSSGGGDDRPDLWLQLHPYMDNKAEFCDAILNGVEIFKVNNSDGSLAGPNPKAIREAPPSSEPKNRVNKKARGSAVLVITLAVLGCTLGLAFIVFAVLFVRRRKKRVEEYGAGSTSKPKSWWGQISYTSASTRTTPSSSLPSNLCRRFSIAEIRAATSDFDEGLVIGKGGFGVVYKGRIHGGSTIIAIKRSDASSSQGVREFETELEMLSKLRHMHLVSLIGYCDDQNEMILVYEYMAGGTLRDHLYEKDKTRLSWKQRLEICIGSARGLLYLHTGTKHPIIHRDIKSTNILLDENLVAKVSDFGLSKVGPTSVSQTHVSTTVKGSIGYLDPEYYRRQHLTDKSDVYSFGVVLLEVLCARSASVQGLPKGQVNLADWAKLNHSKGTIDQIIDPHLTADITRVSLNKFCEIAVRCVHDRGIERPTMNDVVWALEFALQLQETAEKNSTDCGCLMLGVNKAGFPSPHTVVGTTDDDADLFSESTEHASKSTSTDEMQLMRDSSNSGAVFSEIMKPTGR